MRYATAMSVHRVKWKRRVLVCLLGAILLCVPLFLGGALAGFGLRSVYQAIQRAETSILAEDLVTARTELESAAEGLQQAERGSKALLYWKFVPIARSYVFTLDEGIDAARSTLAGVDELLQVGTLLQEAFTEVGLGKQALQNPLAPNRTFRSLTREEKRVIFARLAQVLPRLRIAQERMAIALERWKNVPREGIATSLQEMITLRVAQFERMQTQFAAATQLLEIGLPLAGYPHAKNYLVILQNTDEARGTGGFIGTVGDVRVDTGNVERMIFQDVYSIDLPVSGVWKKPVPAPLAKWLEQKQLFFRDANWLPDFPSTAELLLTQYVEERERASVVVPSPDALIALQPQLFKQLLAFTGPIQVEDQEFRTDNFFDALQYDVHMRFHQNGLPTPQRKEVVAKLGDALFQRLTDVPASDWPRLLDTLTNALTQKDVLLYARDPALQQAIEARGWSGRTKTTSGDYLWVVDSNMGALKTDGVMDKQLLYTVEAKRDGSAQATLTLRYKNTNSAPTWRYSRYRDYVRVYVPEGAELLSTRGAMEDDLFRTGGKLVPGRVDVYKELGKTVFGAFFAVEPGKTGEITFTYRFPASLASRIQAGTYELLVQKQPGNTSRFAIEVRAPHRVRSALPAEDPAKFGDALYQKSVRIEKDLSFSVGW